MKLPLLKKHNHAGFTLMEVMVSVSIFAIIITIGIGSLLTIYSALKKTRADQQALDSLSFVMDTMTRRIRTGTEYEGGGDSITFRDQIDNDEGGNQMTYSVGTDGDGNLRLFSLSDEDNISYDITPQNLNIETFYVDLYSDPQPMVTIHLSGSIKNGRTEQPLSIQTSVSQRSFAQNAIAPTVKPTGTSDGGGTTGGGIRPPRTETGIKTPDGTTESSAQGTGGGTADAINAPR